MRSMLRSLIVVGSAVLIVSGWWSPAQPASLWRTHRSICSRRCGVGGVLPRISGPSGRALLQVWASPVGHARGQIPLPSWMMTGLLVVVLICLGGLCAAPAPCV